MRIAVVDDRIEERIELKKLLLDSDTDGKILEYGSGEDFLAGFEPGKFDVVFMDIYMGGMDGMTAAKRLRERDPACAVVFLTTSTDFGIQSYSVRAADYIVKPATPAALARALRYCRPAKRSEGPSVRISYRRRMTEIPMKKILYADMDGRTVLLHTADGVLNVGGTFAEVTEPLLKSGNFQICYRGVVVALRQISSFGERFLTLRSGERLPVSRKYRRTLENSRLTLEADSLRGGM